MLHWLDDITIHRLGKAPAGRWDSNGNWVIDAERGTGHYDEDNIWRKDPEIKQPGANTAVNSFNQVQRLLINNGMPAAVAPFGAAVAAFETAAFTSNVSKKDFNLSGILWINKPYQNATKGLPRPKKEGGYYAHFKDHNAWAKDFIRILSIGGANAPIRATNLQDFVARMKANGYFKSAAGPYLASLQLILKTAGVLQTQQKEQLQLAKDKILPKVSWFRKHPIWTGAIITVGAVLTIRAVNN